MLRYRLEGTGAPLLLIHGWGVTYAIWQNLVPLLKPHFQLVMIELPGVGGSPTPDSNLPYYQVCADAIEEVREALGIRQWAVLAYSSGTRAAEAYIKQYPGSISHALFLCPTYILEIWSMFVRLLAFAPQSSLLTQWVFSDWRLHSLVRAFGFNGRRHDYTYLWTNEIELQSLSVLIRSLYEMPGQGRAPFHVTEVPTLFIWGNRDALISPPRLLGPHDVIIPADHSAPMLAAAAVANAVVPFVTEGKRVSFYHPTGLQWSTWNWQYRQRETKRASERRRLLGLPRSSSRPRFSLRKQNALRRVQK